MDDDRIERLLRGYLMPDVPRELDHRVLSEVAALLERARTRATAIEIGWSLLDRLGFGYLGWLADWITTTDAEYRVEFV